MKQINPPEPEPTRKPQAASVDISEAAAKFAPGWTVSNCGGDMSPGLRAEFRGKPNVLVTHPRALDVPCSLSKTLEVPAGKKTVLTAEVAHDLRGDWVLSESKPCVLSRSPAIPADGRTTLVLDVAHHSPRHDWVLAVRADGKPLLVGDVSSETSEDLWRSVRVDLSTLAGKTVNLELENRANNWSCEAGYWSQIAVEHGSPEAKQD